VFTLGAFDDYFSVAAVVIGVAVIESVTVFCPGQADECDGGVRFA
jgi:hypothetical protein